MFRHKRLPSLNGIQEREVTDEFRQVERELNLLEARVATVEREKLNITDAVATFQFATYIEKAAPADVASSDLGIDWIDITSPIQVPPTPLGITDQPNGQFSFNFPGVYLIAVNGAFEHNSLNAGRNTFIRPYDYTTSTAANTYIVPTGRNAEATSISLMGIIEILETEAQTEFESGHNFGFQMGGGDDYSAVVINNFGISITNIGLWQLPLGSQANTFRPNR